ncbi:Ig-like domain-containing protein [Pontibacter sp. CAU 1760]
MKDFKLYTCQTGQVHQMQLQGLWRYVMGMLTILLAFCNTASGQAVQKGIAPVVIPQNGFAIDGDLRARTPITAPFSSSTGDWLPNPTAAGTGEAVLNASGAPLDDDATFHRVDLYNSGDNVFAGGQKKNDNPNLMSWINGNPSPAKNDINNLLMHIGRQTDGDIWITVSGDRESTNGNSFISIALHQAKLSLDPVNTGKFLSEAPAGTGGRTPGDVQVSAEFTGGGSNPNLYLEEWKLVGGVYKWNPINLPANSAYGSTNGSVLSGVPYDAFGGSSYPVNAFIEVTFNISQIYRETSTPCVGSIASAFVMTKSSQAESANLTDFVDPIQINLDINVGRPTASGATYCTGDAISSLTATGQPGATFKWYTALNSEGKPTGTPTEGATYTPTINNAVAGVHNFYVTQSIRGCESMHSVVTITVNDRPAAPTTAPVVYCVGDVASALTATGSNLKWYTDATGGTGSATAPTPSTATASSTTYYVSSTTNNCEGPRASLLVTVNAKPTIAFPSIGAICFGAPSASLTHDGITGGANQYRIDWDAAANTAGLADIGLTDLPPTPSITISGTGSLAAGTYNGTIYVKNTTTGCESVGDEVQLVVNEQVVGPEVDYIAPKCDEIYFKVQITNPVAGTTYTLSRVGYANRVINYTSGTAIFENLEAGSGYSIVASIGECTSDARACGDAAKAALGTQSSVQSLQGTRAIETKTMTAYPVPFYDRATVEFTAEKTGDYVVNLYDLKGTLIRQLKAGTAKEGEMNKIEVNGNNLPEGMYLVRFVNGAGSKTIKLLKKQ